MRARFLIAALAVSMVSLVAGGCAAEADDPIVPESQAPASEPTQEVAQAAGSCPESLVCPTYNGGSMMKQVYKNCDAQGDMLSMTCTYWNGSTVVKTPSATNCNECVVNTSQGAAACGQTTLTTYANASCSSG
ncbi:MAG: hypothetical protein IT477_10640 [Rhodanobacteraceae bacterium]|nr:hypothetical protein [Rhodanobacteraceae bacterium]